MYHVPSGNPDLPAQAETLYKRKRFHEYHDSPQTDELHQQYIAMANKVKERKQHPTRESTTPKPPILQKVEFNGDIPSLPPMPQPVIPQMYPPSSDGGGGGGGGGLGNFFTNQLSEMFNPQEKIESLFSLAAL